MTTASFEGTAVSDVKVYVVPPSAADCKVMPVSSKVKALTGSSKLSVSVSSERLRSNDLSLGRVVSKTKSSN